MLRNPLGRLRTLGLLELDESAPPGCRTELMRADAGKVRHWLECLYRRGGTQGELLPDGSLRFPGFLDDCHAGDGEDQ